MEKTSYFLPIIVYFDNVVFSQPIIKQAEILTDVLQDDFAKFVPKINPLWEDFHF